MNLVSPRLRSFLGPTEYTEWQWPLSGVHSTITYTVVVYAPVDRAGQIHSPYFSSTPILCYGHQLTLRSSIHCSESVGFVNSSMCLPLPTYVSRIDLGERYTSLSLVVQGINEDVKRKLAEGEVSDPFTRRKTKPVLSTGGKVRLIVKVKGTVSINRFQKCWQKFTQLGLNKAHRLFLLDTWYGTY